MLLEGARCLVTGASSGIGRAVSERLLEVGATVFAGARVPADAAALEERGACLVELDVTDDRQVRAAVAAAEPLHVIVNNAGYGLEGAIEEVADDELLAQYDVNVFGLWRVCRAALPGMRSRGRGAIVNISSFGGQAPFPGIGAYRSSKFAVEGISWTLHLEVAHFGIRVLDVQPGLVDTDFGTRSIRRARAASVDSVYEAMREVAARSYPRMSPEAAGPHTVAERIVSELAEDDGPLRLRIGVDAERLTAAAEAGPEAYDRFIIDDLGFSWHCAPRLTDAPQSLYPQEGG